MNCKPGDLAVIVRGVHEYIGAIVEVIGVYDGVAFADCGPAWWVLLSGEEFHSLDAYLRPLRDNDGEDETITWAGKPQGVTA